MKELDNIRIKDLDLVLDPDTALNRYRSVIAVKKEIIQSLLQNNITDKYTFFSHSTEELSQTTGVPSGTLALLGAFLHSYDYKKRRLAELACIDPALIEALASDGIKDSLTYIRLYQAGPLDALAERYGMGPEVLTRIFSLCDLMRLPGVKSTRANLYHQCGYHNIKDLAGKDAEAVQAAIRQTVTKNARPESVPFLKELKTQIAAAAVLPAIKESRA